LNWSLERTLKALPYFASGDPMTIQLLVDGARRRSLRADEAIFHEGDSSEGLWIVESGRVKIFKVNPNGEEHIFHLLGEGNTFGDVAALDGGANPANAAALSEANVWLLPSASLDAAMERDPALARQIVRLLAARVRMLVGQIESLALYSVVARLARFLLQQADNPALSGPGVTRAAIAAHLATTPETISRALRSLEESGAIRFDRHRIVIEREDVLRTLAAL
jgi:CRP/FNR family transcriptional regulator